MYLILPGFSKKNESEATEIENQLSRFSTSIYLHRWQHWDNADSKWNPIKEIDLIRNKIDGSITIISKSIGTYIAASLLTLHTPENLILMGIPVNDLSVDELNVYFNLQKLKKFSVVQNKYDPHGSATQVEALLSGSKYQLYVKDENTHSYPYAQDILSLLDLK
jgi:hypothetical protein